MKSTLVGQSKLLSNVSQKVKRIRRFSEENHHLQKRRFSPILLNGMFRCSASLVIPHLRSFAAMPCASLVLLGHTNRSVSFTHKSQREIALI